MISKVDPIIAVKDVEASALWYMQIFGFRRKHVGDAFAVMVSDEDEIMLCLHKWGEHHHPTMTNSNIAPGNGLILYFRTKDLNIVLQNIEKLSGKIEEEIHLNTNSLKNEFSLRDPDGYFLTITEFHKYEG